jgi:methionine aminopeptidase
VNIDVSAYHGGYHGDLNETYYVTATGSSTTPPDYSDIDDDTIRVVETARECLAKAIELVKPGMLFRHPGDVIEKHAKSQQCSVIRTYCGHGINTLFHAAPNVPHYAKNKAIGEAKPGMCFTIEPMIALGTWRDQTWPDNWTSSTTDGKKTAQFGTWQLLIEYKLTRHRTYYADNRGWRRDLDGKTGGLSWWSDSKTGTKGGGKRHKSGVQVIDVRIYPIMLINSPWDNDENQRFM